MTPHLLSVGRTRTLDPVDYELVGTVTTATLIAWLVVLAVPVLARPGPLDPATYFLMVALLGVGLGLAGFYSFLVDHLLPETMAIIRRGLYCCSIATAASVALYLGWSADTSRLFATFGFWASAYLAGIDVSNKFELVRQ